MCIYYFNFLDYTCKGLLHSSFAWDQEFSILLHCVFGYICMVLCSYVSVGPGGLKQSQQIRTLTEQYGGGGVWRYQRENISNAILLFDSRTRTGISGESL